MLAFIDEHRAQFGVEPICRVLPIAPSTYFKHKAAQREPARRSARAQGDDVLRAIICRIWHEHRQVYGSRKVWRQMGREGLRVARGRVRRLMRQLGLAGAVRGRAWTTTTRSAPTANQPRDLVDRHFSATRPNQLWVSDFTYVATWRGFVYVAFVIDVFARRIVGGSRHPWPPISSSTHSSKRSTTAASGPRTVWSITVTAARSISRCGTPTASPMPASRRRSVVAATRTITRSTNQ